MQTNPNCDIFCRIVDNYGDIGICWRLAKQLSQEYGWKTRLWVDDLHIAKRLIPEINSNVDAQIINEIEIAHWQENFTDNHIPQIVIEAFGCELPESYIKMMVTTQPLWINLEYLSAEAWVEDFHAQPSQHPTLPLTKYFFFPGFTENTGGLIREKNLSDQRSTFQQSNEMRAAFWQSLNIRDETKTKVSLFCYPHAPVTKLLDSFATSPHPISCFVPGNGLAPIIQQYFDIPHIEAGMMLSKGALHLHILPFLSQDDYDRLLWACDLNFVRGEDSWIRAIWAAKPFIWQPYQQEQNAHLSKLEAFLTLYAKDLSPETLEILRAAYLTWSSPNSDFTENNLHNILERLPELSGHSDTFSTVLALQNDLASKLVNLYKNRV